MKPPTLSPIPTPDGTYRMGCLYATPAAVEAVLGKPNQPDDSDGKSTHCYAFRTDDEPYPARTIVCWYYRNARGFSIWGDMGLWEELFPGLIRPN